MKQIRERDIEDFLVRNVKALGGEVRKVKWIGRSGAPDRLVMLPDPFSLVIGSSHSPQTTIWVELKAPGKQPEPHQRREHERMRKMGQHVVVIDSLDGVRKLLGLPDEQSASTDADELGCEAIVRYSQGGVG